MKKSIITIGLLFTTMLFWGQAEVIFWDQGNTTENIAANVNDEIKIIYKDADGVADFYTHESTEIYLYAGLDTGVGHWQYIEGDINNSATLGTATRISTNPNVYEITLIPRQYFTGLPDGTTVYGMDIIFRNHFGVGGNNQTANLYINLNDADANDTDSDVNGPVLGSQPNPGTISSLVDTDPEAINVFDFNIVDQGSGDGINTKVTQVSLLAGGNNTADWSTTIGGIKLSLDGGLTFETIGTPVITSSNIVIPIISGNLDILDGTNQIVNVFIYLNNTGLTDNEVLEFEVTTTSHGFTADPIGSNFATNLSGAISNQISIEVQATELQFIQQPTNTIVNTIMSPSVVLAATDVNGNIDVDFNGVGASVGLTSTGIFDPSATIEVDASNGVATFSNLIFSVLGSGLTLTTTDPDAWGYTNPTSSPFAIYTTCEPVPITYTQDFELVPATPTLTYITTGIAAIATGVGNTPNDPKYAGGSQGIEIKNNSAEIIFETLDATYYTDIEFSVRLASFSGNSNNGADVEDNVTIAVSTDDGTTWSNEAQVNGNTNARWSFISGTGVVTVPYDGDNAASVSAPAGGGARTTDGYSTIQITGLPNSSQLKIKISIVNNQPQELWVLDNAILTANDNPTTIWDGAWSSGSAPDLYTKAVIAEDYDTAVEGDITTCGCQVNIDKVLTISAGNYLEVGSDIENNGTIVVEHEGSVVQYNETDANSGTGIFKIHKTTSPYNAKDYTYFSSPIQGGTIAGALGTFDRHYYYVTSNYLDLFSGNGFPQTAPGADGFDDASPFDWQPASGTMTAGVGYIARDPVESPTGTTVIFSTGASGRVNNGPVDVIIEKDLYTPLMPNSTGSDEELLSNNNGNLIGNPYPSAISLTDFYQDTDNTSKLTGTFYFWTHNTAISSGTPGPWTYNYDANDFASYNVLGTPAGLPAGSGGPIPTGFVASGQSFMAAMDEASSSPATITFKNAHRVTDNNDQFFKAPTQEVDRIRLSLTTEEGETRPILVGFEEGASDAYDPYDSPRMENGTATDFYSYVSTENTLKLAIQRLEPFVKTKIVPLGIEIYTSGTHTITIDQVEGIFDKQQKIYLKDYKTNTLHKLSKDPYVFMVSETELGEIKNRFELRFKHKKTADIDEAIINSIVIYPNPSENIFNISWNGQANANIIVYDLASKLIKTDSIQQNTNSYQLDLSGYTSGFYYAKIQLDGQQIVKKLILK